MSFTITAEQAQECLIAYGIATENEIALVSSINGHNVETYESILYVRLGYRTFEQMENA